MRAGRAVTRLLGVVKDDKAGLEREGTLSRLGKERQWFGVLGGGRNEQSFCLGASGKGEPEGTTLECWGSTAWEL